MWAEFTLTHTFQYFIQVATPGHLYGKAPGGKVFQGMHKVPAEPSVSVLPDTAGSVDRF